MRFSIKTTVAALAVCAAAAPSAAADFGIAWQGDLINVTDSVVAPIWQEGVLPQNGMGIWDWCASGFANGEVCVDEFVRMNQQRLQAFVCGGGSGTNWLCANQAYVFPQRSNAIAPVMVDSPSASELRAYVDNRFDQFGNEIATQAQALAAMQATQDQVVANQAALTGRLNNQVQAIELLGSKVDDGFVMVDSRLNELELLPNQVDELSKTVEQLRSTQATQVSDLSEQFALLTASVEQNTSALPAEPSGELVVSAAAQPQPSTEAQQASAAVTTTGLGQSLWSSVVDNWFRWLMLLLIVLVTVIAIVWKRRHNDKVASTKADEPSTDSSKASETPVFVHGSGYQRFDADAAELQRAS